MGVPSFPVIRTAAAPGRTLYAVILDGADAAWDGATFAAIAAADWPAYALPMAAAAGTGLYAADAPADLPAGTYAVVAYDPADADPDPADADPDPAAGGLIGAPRRPSELRQGDRRLQATGGIAALPLDR